jgi:response regulator RpfG family c-di-GMP phosphodiesterase
LNYLQNPIKIEDLHEKTTGTDPFIFNLTMKVFENLQIAYFTHEFEEKTLTMTHDTLFGFIYSMVKKVFEEMSKNIEPKRVEELVSFNLTNFFLFFQPVNITEQEEVWVENHLKRTGDVSNSVSLKVPLHHKKYYLINLKRILDKNRDNPEFNDSVLDFMGNDMDD